METATTDQQPAAEPPRPYDKFRVARDGLMRDFLDGLGNIETYLIEHDRAWERKLEAAKRDNSEQAKDIIRLTAELAHRPPAAITWNALQDLGENHNVLEGTIVPDQGEEIAALRRELADQAEAHARDLAEIQGSAAGLEGELAAERETVAQLRQELATEKDNSARLERDYRILEEKVEHDHQEWTSQESARQGEVSQAAEEASRLLAEARADVARLNGEVSELNGKVSEEQELRSQAEASAARAAEDTEAEKRRADGIQEELELERNKPTPPPAEVDVAAVKALADEEAKDRVAKIVLAIEEDNPGISLNSSLEMFATAWAAPPVEEPAGGEDESAAPGDLFDFTLPPPDEDEEIPYVPNEAAVAAGH